MSVDVTIRTTKEVKPDEIFKGLADNGEKIVVVSDKYPCLKFGNDQKAIRGIEVNKEDNGLEVRVCSYASVADYQLFAKTIALLQKITGDKAYEWDDDECVVEDPFVTYNDEWIEDQRESSFSINKALATQANAHIVRDGLFAQFSIGPKMLEEFYLNPEGKYDKEDMDNADEFLQEMQFFLADKESTRTQLVIKSPKNEDDRGLTVSAISIQGGEVSKFDYISEADIFAIFDYDDKDSSPVLIPFEEVWKILPRAPFDQLDELQYLRTDEITVDMVHEMMNKARHLQPDDIFYQPTYPGDGYDEAQNTVVLMWNPAISSMKLDEHNQTIPRMLTEYFNWSVWDYEHAKCGDRFYLVKVGNEGNNGIVMSGVFDSQPHELDDWSGKGRQTFYMDMKPNVILNPDTAPMLTADELTKAIPTFDWTGGHSGRILSKDEAMKLEELWHQYVEKHKDDVDGVNMNAFGLQEIQIL